MRCSDATKDAELPKRVFGQQRVLQQFQAGFWCFQAVILFKNVLLLSHFYTDHPWNVTCHVLSCENYHIRTLYFIQFRAPLDMALHYNMGDIFHLRIYGDMQFFPSLAWRPCVKSWWRAIRIAWSLNWPLLLGCKAICQWVLICFCTKNTCESMELEWFIYIYRHIQKFNIQKNSILFFVFVQKSLQGAYQWPGSATRCFGSFVSRWIPRPMGRFGFSTYLKVHLQREKICRKLEVPFPHRFFKPKIEVFVGIGWGKRWLHSVFHVDDNHPKWSANSPLFDEYVNFNH